MMKSLKLHATVLAIALTGVFGLNAHAVGPAYNGGANLAYVCTNDGGNVILRSGPSRKNSVIARMPTGSAVRIISETDVAGWTWYKVRYGKLVGWARHDYICA